MPPIFLSNILHPSFSVSDDKIYCVLHVHGNMVWLGSVFCPLLGISSLISLCYSPLLGQSPKIMPISLSEKCKIIGAGCPIILQCEVSDPVAQVSWFKDEVELFSKTGLDMRRDGSLRNLIIHSAKVSDSGLYSCSLTDDVVTFHVDVEGDFLDLTLTKKASWCEMKIIIIILIITIITFYLTPPSMEFGVR